MLVQRRMVSGDERMTIIAATDSDAAALSEFRRLFSENRIVVLSTVEVADESVTFKIANRVGVDDPHPAQIIICGECGSNKGDHHGTGGVCICAAFARK